MHTQITARHFNATQTLREYTMQRLVKLERYYAGILNAHVILEHMRLTSNNSVEISIHIQRNVIVARATATKHTQAIDACILQLQRQLIKYKGKVHQRRRPSPSELIGEDNDRID